jgi:hypothetical protein
MTGLNGLFLSTCHPERSEGSAFVNGTRAEHPTTLLTGDNTRVIYGKSS